jgi:hypothetical protein
MNTTYLNVLPSSLLAFTALSAFMYAQINNGERYHRAFSLFFGVLWLIVTINYLLLSRFDPIPHGVKVTALTLDVFANVSLFLSAYSLLTGAQFSWRSQTFFVATICAFLIALLILLLGTVWEGESLVWNILYTSPSAVFATAVFAFLGYAAFRDPHVAPFRVQALVICSIYAFLQVPAYFCHFVTIPAIQEGLSQARSVMSGFLIIGKFSIFLCFLFCVVSVAKRNGGSGAHQLLGWLKWTLGIVNVALLASIVIHRLTQYIELAKNAGQ